MPNAPEKPEPSALWKAITSEDTRPTMRIRFPRKLPNEGKDQDILVRVLTVEEQVAAAMEANAFAKKWLKAAPDDEHDLAYERVFTDAFMVEALWRACRAPDVKWTAFPVPQEMRARVTMPEIEWLFEQYQLACVELGPAREFLTEDNDHNDYASED